MEVTPGYKVTEVGVIPDEWDLVAAGEIGRFRGGSGFPLRYQGEYSGAYPFFKVSDMNNEGNETFMRTSNHYIGETTRKTLGATLFPTNSIVFAKVGAAVFLERKRILAQTSCLDNNMAAYELDNSKADHRFIHYRLLQTRFGELVSTTALPSLSGKVLSAIRLPLPPLDEQRAIAEALSDVDALLTQLDRIISKKRDIKQAAMQQLLTGKTRLPGFSGDWQPCAFEAVLERLNAKVHQLQTSGYQTVGRYPVVDQGQQPVVGYSDEGERRFQCPPGGVVVFGDHTCIVKFVDFDFLVGADGTQVLQARPGHDTRFLAYELQREGIQQTGYNRHFKFLKERRFKMPPLAEQTAIATLLSDLDAELATLEAHRDKTRALKQGMMQELLTGKTRLV